MIEFARECKCDLVITVFLLLSISKLNHIQSLVDLAGLVLGILMRLSEPFESPLGRFKVLVLVAVVDQGSN